MAAAGTALVAPFTLAGLAPLAAVAATISWTSVALLYGLSRPAGAA